MLCGSAPFSAVAAASPLPACRYADVLTKYRTYHDWRRTLLDPIYMIPRSYGPTDLVSTSGAGLNGGHYVRSFVIYELKRMFAAARAARAPFAVQSAYRSYSTQAAVFAREVQIYGYTRALKQVARAGHSEHQLGTTLDFRSYSSTTAPWYYADWATTRAGAWLKANAWKYGFIMSYPKDRSSVTCYDYEPWHYRYVGPVTARAVHYSGLTLRQYLWYRAGNGG